MYQLILMSFNGEYQTEHPEFETIEKAWDYENDLGSKWYYYPFPFVISGNTIRGAGYMMEWTIGRKVKTIQKIFKAFSEKEECLNMGVEEFAFHFLKQ
jgi:hypothetical protein